MNEEARERRDGLDINRDEDEQDDDQRPDSDNGGIAEGSGERAIPGVNEP